MRSSSKTDAQSALPHCEDSIKFAKAMLAQSVILAPGTVFSPHAEGVSPYCRFNVAYLKDPRFAAALKTLG